MDRHLGDGDKVTNTNRTSSTASQYDSQLKKGITITEKADNTYFNYGEGILPATVDGSKCTSGEESAKVGHQNKAREYIHPSNIYKYRRKIRHVSSFHRYTI